MTEYRIPAHTEIFFGAPAKKPSAELLDALDRGTAPFADVRAFYVFQLATKKDSNLVVGVELTDASRESVVMAAVVKSIGAHLPPGTRIDVLHLTNGLLAAVAGHVPRHERRPRQAEPEG